jgi:hypothetical protein
VDLVYPVRPGEPNEWLRYSLRSAAANLPHDRVWVVGFKPKWLTGVEYLATNQARSKWENSTANMMTACLTDDVSPSFVYMNDDFYVLRPVEGVERLNRGTITAVLAHYRNRNARGSYVRGMEQTRALLRSLGYDEPVSYELHAPMVIERARMVEALHVAFDHAADFPMQAIHKRSVYGNLVGYGGRTIEDVKINMRVGRARLNASVPYASSSRQSWGGTFGRQIRALFPDPSPYERSTVGR